MTEPIRVSDVVFRDRRGRVLTVRKRRTTAFMLPGGKPEPGEGPVAAAVRECSEELGVALDPGMLRPIGEFEAVAANEPGRMVSATVFAHPLVPVGSPRAEIEELAWKALDDAAVAPLLREAVFPALRSRRVERVTVFTGSAAGDSPRFAQGAADLARAFAGAGVGVVYGGGRVGLMGVLADTARAAGGQVFGVMPQALVDDEIAHEHLTRLDVVPDMPARKRRMSDLGDAFVALPGGAGTLEELFEAWTWQQLGIHDKPVALYDIDGYWQPLLRAIEEMTRHGFLAERFRAALVVERDPRALLAALNAWTPPAAKWQS